MINHHAQSLPGYSAFRLVCRPAVYTDKGDVLELTRTIWEGNDYVPYVWDDWIRDSSGLLAVAQYGMQVIGLCKLSRFSDHQWWLEGLRVDPRHEGKGVARHLFGYMMDYWQKNYHGAIRLYTSEQRIPVHRLCDRFGFRRIGEILGYKAEVARGLSHSFTPVHQDEVVEVLPILHSPEAQFLNFGLMNDEWRAGSPNIDKVLTYLRIPQRLWWWRGRTGLVFVFIEREDNPPAQYPYISFLICPPNQLSELLLEFRYLASEIAQSLTHVYWAAPVNNQLLNHLNQAGFTRDWDHSVYIFEKIDNSPF